MDIVLGVLKACQKVMENEILRSINPFERWFFQTKKTIFSNILGPKMAKICYFELWDQKPLWGEKGTEYITSISIVSRFGRQLNMVKFSIVWSSRPF